MKCTQCQKNSILKASKPMICWACAKELGICIYCGAELYETNKERGVCSLCDPPKVSGVGSRQRGYESADRQYHGGYVE